MCLLFNFYGMLLLHACYCITLLLGDPSGCRNNPTYAHLCDEWAGYGECTKSPEFMRIFCPVSCRYCETTTTSSTSTTLPPTTTTQKGKVCPTHPAAMKMWHLTCGPTLLPRSYYFCTSSIRLFMYCNFKTIAIM